MQAIYPSRVILQLHVQVFRPKGYLQALLSLPATNRMKGPKLGRNTFCSTGCSGKATHQHIWTPTEPTWVFSAMSSASKPTLSFKHLFKIKFLFPSTLHHLKLCKPLCFLLLDVLLFLQFASKKKKKARIKAKN